MKYKKNFCKTKYKHTHYYFNNFICTEHLQKRDWPYGSNKEWNIIQEKTCSVTLKSEALNDRETKSSMI